MFTKQIQRLYTLSLSVLMATLAVPMVRVSGIAMAICVALGLWHYIATKGWRGWHWQREMVVYVLMIVSYGMLWVRQLWDPCPTSAYFHAQTDIRLPMLIVGLFGLGGALQGINRRAVAYTMLISSTLVSIAAFYLWYQPVPWGGVDPWDRYEWQHMVLGTHMQMDLYMNLSILLAVWLLTTERSVILRVMVAILTAVVAGKLMLSDGRSGVVSLCVVVCLMIGYYSFRRWGWRVSPVLLIVLGVSGSFILHHPRIQDKATITDNPRLALWSVAEDMIRERPWTGYGLSSGSVIYTERAQADSECRRTYVDRFMERYHLQTISPHSLYLQLGIETGIWGPLVWVSIFLLACWLAPAPNRVYGIGFALVILWQSVFDGISSNFNPLLIAWVLAMLLMSDRQPTEADDHLANPEAER